jgi:hypothetical protein
VNKEIKKDVNSNLAWAPVGTIYRGYIKTEMKDLGMKNEIHKFESIIKPKKTFKNIEI